MAILKVAHINQFTGDGGGTKTPLSPHQASHPFLGFCSLWGVGSSSTDQLIPLPITPPPAPPPPFPLAPPLRLTMVLLGAQEVCHRGFAGLVAPLLRAGASIDHVPDPNASRGVHIMRGAPQSPLGEAARGGYKTVRVRCVWYVRRDTGGVISLGNASLKTR